MSSTSTRRCAQHRPCLLQHLEVHVAQFPGHPQYGQWAESELVRDGLAAPHLMPVEAANILRRAVLARDLAPDTAALAHADLTRLRVALFGYESSALRVWQLRETLSAYDAWYVALAESLDAPLVTLDRRMACATGPRCTFRFPPAPDPGNQDE